MISLLYSKVRIYATNKNIASYVITTLKNERKESQLKCFTIIQTIHVKKLCIGKIIKLCIYEIHLYYDKYL